MTEATPPEARKGNSMGFRKSRGDRPRLDKDKARRQGAISTLAFTVLGGREEAMAFLNTTCETLDARPIDLAMNSELGYIRVETLIRKMAAKAG
jgi:uncharacterized protein (DUF2384 family)